MHHTSHNCLANAETKLILCHVIWDTPVTKLCPKTPAKPKPRHYLVAKWGLTDLKHYIRQTLGFRIT